MAVLSEIKFNIEIFVNNKNEKLSFFCDDKILTNLLRKKDKLWKISQY